MSLIGNKLKIEIFGASHAECIGVNIYGFPKNFSVDFDSIMVQMARRAPGNGAYGTTRKEPDIPVIESGIENGVTNGEVIKAVIYNTNQHSKDYENLKIVPRPAHADYTAYLKFCGKEDMRGGGKFSGRLTAPLVFAGALCRQLLKTKGIEIAAHVKSIGDINDDSFDYVNPSRDLMQSLSQIPFAVINENKKAEMLELMAECRKNLDSVAGSVELVATGIPVGLCDGLFDGFEGKTAPYFFGIPAVKSVHYGKIMPYGSQNNDEFCVVDGKVVTKTNNCGGILGGITNGMPIVLTVDFKPTPSISRPQMSVDMATLSPCELVIKGRHDPCVVPRAVVCVESAFAVALCDIMLCENKL